MQQASKTYQRQSEHLQQARVLSLLQTLPMSVLYDGKQYLIEKYAIALTPGLRLLDPQINQVNCTGITSLVINNLIVQNT